MSQGTAVGSVLCRTQISQETRQSGVLRIFLSSTFRDMQQERDCFFQFGAPLVYTAAKRKALELVFYDLRWGITSEESGSGQVIQLCLQAISVSPYFVCFLGERYGWVPNQENPVEWHPSTGVQYPWLADLPNISVTEMEIQYAALIPSAVSYRPFFYYRDPESVQEMLKSASDAHIFYSESTHHKERQDRLKRIISDRYPHSVYHGPMSFAEAVASDLIRAIEIDYPDQQEMSLEEFAHFQFMRNKSLLFQGFKDELESLVETIRSDIDIRGHCPIFISSPGGSGKSSFITALKQTLLSKSSDILLVMHYVGCSDESLIVEKMIDRFYNCSLNKQSYRGFAEESNDSSDSEDGSTGSNKSLASLFSELSKSEKKVLFVIDSVHMFSESLQEPFPEKLTWLPQVLPPNAHLLLTVDEGHQSYEIMKSRNCREVSIRPMSEPEVQLTIESYFSMYNKKLTQSQVYLLSSSEETANPSFLKIVLDQLRTFGVFESLENEMRKLISFSGVQELYQYVIQGFEQRFGEELVRECLLVLLISRTGLTIDHLLSYLTQNCTGFDTSKWFV